MRKGPGSVETNTLVIHGKLTPTHYSTLISRVVYSLFISDTDIQIKSS